MKEITLEELLEAGCHFGHQVTRHNPKSRDFVFEARDNIHIIDLVKTKEGLDTAAVFIKDLASKGGTLVIVGTKRQAKGIVEEVLLQAQTAGAGEGLYSVTNRWIGGTLTNFAEVGKNYKKLAEITERLKNDEEKAKYTKKEVGLWEKKRVKLSLFYSGIAKIEKIPDAVFIIDTHLEELAVTESRAMGVTTIGIVDTNADPAMIGYPIPANDDAVGSIKLIANHIIEAWIEGCRLAKDAKEEIITKDTKAEEKSSEDQKKEKPKKEKVVKKSTKRAKTVK